MKSIVFMFLGCIACLILGPLALLDEAINILLDKFYDLKQE